MKFNKMIYGGDYNPDQWTEDIWQEDVRLMKEAGVNLVSLGIFSWVKLEPQDGVFEFSWLDTLMDLLNENGIGVDLATPTASPPAWMVTQHEDILPVTSEGFRLWHGSRRHYCPHNLKYSKYAVRIAKVLAERYKNHPALKMWHIDNEYGCHVGECFCDHSVKAFQDWLEAKYKGIEQFNHAWGTAFWGQTYGAWSEIQPPRRTPAHTNPAQQLDWMRFMSDSWIACYDEQRDVIKQITPEIEITTNYMGFHKGVDYFKFAKHQDLVANDNYPDTNESDWMAKAGLVCDLIRSVGENKPWLLMEQSTSQVNWRHRNVNKRPGVMRLGSMQAVARGADGIMFFQWRQSKAGAEKHHSGMVPHAGTETRVWREVKGLGNELADLNEIVGSTVKAEVALLFDWNNWWALEIDSKPSADLLMLPQVYKLYRYFYERNITVDVVHPDTDLSQYKLAVMPNLYMVSDRSTENINRFVESGGTLLMTYFSGIVDENEHIRLGGYPAPFRKMLGLWVEEYAAYPEGLMNEITCSDEKYFSCSFWSDIIHLEGAHSLATFKEDYFAGLPAFTQHTFGKGKAYYLGTELENDGNDWVLGQVCQAAEVIPLLEQSTAGVEAVRRWKGDQSWLFLVNYQNKDVMVDLPINGLDILTQKVIGNKVLIPAQDVLILKEDK
jgi:beta-galactosidase